MLSRRKKVVFIAIGCIILLILYLLKGTSYFLRVTTFIFASILFYFVDSFFDLRFKKIHYFIFILIATAGVLASPLYFISADYDKFLHLISPFLVGILIFFLIDKTQLKSSTKLLMTFAVILMFLSLFEIAEFILDQLFDLKTQGVFTRDISGLAKFDLVMDRNEDTMWDLILGTISSLVFVGYKIVESKVKKCKIK